MLMTITQATIDLLNKSHIYGTSSGSNRFKVGDKLGISTDSTYEPHVFFTTNYFCSIGSFSYSWSPLSPMCTIGRYSSIATGVSLIGYRHPYNRFTTSGFSYYKGFKIYDEVLSLESKFNVVDNPQPTPKVTVGNDVWIGSDSILKPGITIGDGAVIGTHSLVTKDVAPYTIVGGMPAKFIKHRFPMEIIAELLNLQWWRYLWTDFNFAGDIPIEEFIERLYVLIANNKLKEYKPEFLAASELLKTSG